MSGFIWSQGGVRRRSACYEHTVIRTWSRSDHTQEIELRADYLIESAQYSRVKHIIGRLRPSLPLVIVLILFCTIIGSNIRQTVWIERWVIQCVERDSDEKLVGASDEGTMEKKDEVELVGDWVGGTASTLQRQWRRSKCEPPYVRIGQ